MNRNSVLQEKDLIASLRQLREIKPNQEWVVLAKSRILGDAPAKRSIFEAFLPYFKPVLVGLSVFFVVIGVFGYGVIKNALPGDLLYSVRKIIHQSQVAFVSQEEKPALQLQFASDRLQDLNRAPAKNLAAGINEFQASIADAARALNSINIATSSPATIKQIVEGAKKIETNKQKIESLGVVVGGTEELENALGKIVESLISDLGDSTLSQAKTDVLVQMKQLFYEKKYSDALELYLTSQ